MFVCLNPITRIVNCFADYSARRGDKKQNLLTRPLFFSLLLNYINIELYKYLLGGLMNV